MQRRLCLIMMLLLLLLSRLRGQKPNGLGMLV
jgi:hypothetical protein